MNSLAERYWHGNGVNRDRSKAIALYRKAADLGNGDAMLQLGYLHESGRDLPLSQEQAVAWFRKAVDSGKESAMFHLGVLYWSGRGVSQDFVEAYQWLDLASARASGARVSENAAARDALGRVMSALQIAAARKRAGEWQTAYDLRKKKA